MNKAELIEAVAKSTKLTKAAAERACNAVLDSVKKGVKKDGNVTLIGFGSFTVKKRKARMGRNPKTGEAVALPGKHVPHFKPGKSLRERVNNIS